MVKPREPNRAAGECQPDRVDFAHVRQRVTMQQVLEQLGYLELLKGSGPQRRGPCPVHQARGKPNPSFSVNLDRHIFQCFDPGCRAKGNVLDLWAAVHGLTLPAAARDMASTFALELP